MIYHKGDPMETDSRYIDAPLAQYKSIYKDLHDQHVKEYFDDLVEKSKVDQAANKTLNDTIKKTDSERNNVKKQISKLSGLKGLLIFLSIVSIGATIYSIMQITQAGAETLYVLISVFGVALFVLFIFLIIKNINPKLKIAKELKATLDEKIRKMIEEAWQQMKPLNDLFTYGISPILFEKTIPFIDLDDMFDSKKLDYLINAYGFDQDHDKNRSTLYVKSGHIHGNPFFVCNDLVHTLGEKAYSGSITIRWTTTSVVNGRRVTNHHSQVLTATVNKPYPYYQEQPYLVYGNDAAPDLSFDREDSDAELMSEKQIDKMVDKQIKRLSKKSEKSISKGENYTVMGNSEFEVLFGAHNRDHEVQFRLLFTPLAQKQLLELMKDKEIGFGDDFDMSKRKKINYVFPEHLKNFKMDVQPSFFHGYDLEAMRTHFVDYNNAYFRNLYFAFAPLLAIPLYQQQKPHEYIYKDLYDSYVNFYEHERVCNMLNETEFKHPLSQTRNILKTSVVKSEKNCDTIKVTAYGYRTENRVDYVTKLGGDGKMHTIPVHWIEYLPVDKDSEVQVNVVAEKEEETYRDKVYQLFENLKNREIDQKDVAQIGMFIAYISKK
jgi:hypothetical protein